MKQILLIDREFGAGGSTIGEHWPERLNWRLFDQALSEEIARLAQEFQSKSAEAGGTDRSFASKVGQCHLAREF